MDRSDKISILIMCSDDYPICGACTSIIHNIVYEGNLKSYCSNLDVLTFFKNSKQSSEELLGDGLHLYRIYSWKHFSLKQALQLFYTSKKLFFSSVYYKCIIKLYEKIFRSVFLDSITIRLLYKQICQLHLHNYDLVISVSGNFYIAELGRLFTQYLSPSSKFILYQVDPCSTNNVESSASRIDRIRFEKKIYNSANAIFTTRLIIDEAKKMDYHSLMNKFIPIEFANVSESNYLLSKQKNYSSNPYFLVVFSGSLYKNARDPSYTVQLINRINNQKIFFLFVGVDKVQISQPITNPNVLFLGRRSQKTAKMVLRNSNILLNIGNNMLNQVPSKIFEYISFGKPIINICKSRYCSSLPYLEKYPYVLNLFEDSSLLDKNAELMMSFILSNSQKMVSDSFIFSRYVQNTPKYCAKQIIDVFNAIRSSN